MQEKEVYEYLTAHGVKASVQRVAVMQYLLQQMGHPTVDEIYQALVDHYYRRNVPRRQVG